MIDLILSAIIPPIIIAYFIFKNDLYEVEPHKLLNKTFFIGFLIVIPMVLIEILFGIVIKNILVYSIVGVALVEEGIKYLVLLKYNYTKEDFNEPYDGIIYSVMLTMGFALVENVMYVIGGGSDVAILRMITTIPMHATCGIIMGYYLGKAKMENNNTSKNKTLAIAIPTLIHGLYNYFIFIEISAFSLVILIFGVNYALKAIKIHQANSPFKKENSID